MSVKEPFRLFAHCFDGAVQIRVRSDMQACSDSHSPAMQVVNSHLGAMDGIALEEQ